jgi:hypothetical protein
MKVVEESDRLQQRAVEGEEKRQHPCHHGGLSSLGCFGFLGLHFVALSESFLRFLFSVRKLFQPPHGIAVKVRPVRNTKLEARR